MYVQQSTAVSQHGQDIQPDDIPEYPLALCEDQILLPLLKMLPALPHHFLFPIETEITN